MAIQKQYKNEKNGITIENAYTIISQITKITKNVSGGYGIIFLYDTYPSQDARNTMPDYLDRNEICFETTKEKVESTPIFTLCYAELKKQFPDSINC